jgi:hypothetical protein
MHDPERRVKLILCNAGRKCRRGEDVENHARSRDLIGFTSVLVEYYGALTNDLKSTRASPRPKWRSDGWTLVL